MEVSLVHLLAVLHSDDFFTPSTIMGMHGAAGGHQRFIPEKCAFHTNGNAKHGTAQTISGGKPIKIFRKPLISEVPHQLGDRATRPREGSFSRIPLPELDGDVCSF